MITNFHNPSLTKDKDDICILHGCKSMRDDDNGSPPSSALKGVLHEFLGLGVEAGRCLVEEEDLWVTDECSGDADALFLTTA